jgi:hypothetical protein
MGTGLNKSDTIKLTGRVIGRVNNKGDRDTEDLSIVTDREVRSWVIGSRIRSIKCSRRIVGSELATYKERFYSFHRIGGLTQFTS